MEFEESLAVKRGFQSLFLEFFEKDDDNDNDIFLDVTKYIKYYRF